MTILRVKWVLLNQIIIKVFKIIQFSWLFPNCFYFFNCITTMKKMQKHLQHLVPMETKQRAIYFVMLLHFDKHVISDYEN